jgi:two-component system phosphate regulon sensor histidine kinase PhoR
MIVSFLNGIPMPGVLIGEDERIRSMNGQAVDLLGPGLEGRHYITGLRQPDLLDAIETTLRLGQTVTARYLSQPAGREQRWQATASPVTLEAGQGVLICFLDMTPLRDATKMRRDFVANVSHELRTPLTALLGFIETLKGAAKDDPDAQERFLSIMEDEAGRMNRLVQDLLSLSRVESVERMRPTETFFLNRIVTSAISTFTPIAEASNVKLVADGLSDDIQVAGDADQILQVLTNLIENAIKYGGSGGEVRVSLESSEDDPALRGPAATVRVADSGEGIDPVHIPRLTERFYRVDNHRSREMGGTGLGLAIVKHILNRHRGRMKIESVPGSGSTFAISLPIADQD